MIYYSDMNGAGNGDRVLVQPNVATDGGGGGGGGGTIRFVSTKKEKRLI